MEVRFYESIEDRLLDFAVIIARANGKWVFCKHKDRDTYEVPGGHREPGEDIEEAARRELYEETGAISYSIVPVCVYSVVGSTRVGEVLSEESYGMLYYAEITEFEQDLHSEIEHIILSDELVTNWTYPLIQPKLLEEAKRRGIL